MSHLINGCVTFSSFLFFPDFFCLQETEFQHKAKVPASVSQMLRSQVCTTLSLSIHLPLIYWLSYNLTIVFFQFWKKPLLSLSACAPVSWVGPSQHYNAAAINLLNCIKLRERAPPGAYIFWSNHSLSPRYSNASFLPVLLHSAPRAQLRALSSDSMVSTTQSAALLR